MAGACKSLFIGCLLIGLSACGGGDPEEEGGLIGTGIRGTVSELKSLAAELVEIKASSGEISSASLNANRRFNSSTAEGAEPFLLRTNLGNGAFRYALAFKSMPANVNSYSDVVIRSWFATIGGDIDSEFNSTGAIDNLPTLAEYNDLSERIFSVIGAAFPAYDVTGEQLLSDDFNADDSGVDDFLDNNPVIVENQNISVLQTDPVTTLQNEASFGLTLNTPDTIVDTQSPNRVDGVRAFGSGPEEIVVVWNPAIDNIGVVAYQVIRDGNLVGTTPFPVFTDTNNLQPNSSFEYEVIAVDGAGLASFASESAIGATLTAASNEPPPVPTDVRVIATTGNLVEVSWDTDVSVVFAFTVFRGVDGEIPVPYVRSTSVRIEDPAVSSGLEHCYQVAAVNTNNIPSARTEPVCITVGSEAVGTTADSFPALSIPDADAIDCLATFPDSPIIEDLTLSEPCYNVTQTTSLAAFADVVIPAGTVLKFAQGVGLEIEGDASLSVEGNPQNPVVFTGMEAAPGFWTGLHFNAARSPDNSIVNAVIEYAGNGSNNAALRVTSTVANRSRLSVVGSLFRFTEGFGISISDLGTQIDAFDNNVIVENDISADIGPLILPMIGSNNNFTGNLDPLINVPRLTISENLIIPDLGVPLKSNGLLLNQANLTLNAGVEMRFQGDNAFVEIDGGDLFINGTVENPVLLRGTFAEPGHWGGVHLIDSTASNLSNVTIEHGGAMVTRFNANLSAVNSSLTVSNVTLSNSSGFGFASDGQSNVTGMFDFINNLLQ